MFISVFFSSFIFFSLSPKVFCISCNWFKKSSLLCNDKFEFSTFFSNLSFSNFKLVLSSFNLLISSSLLFNLFLILIKSSFNFFSVKLWFSFIELFCNDILFSISLFSIFNMLICSLYSSIFLSFNDICSINLERFSFSSFDFEICNFSIFSFWFFIFSSFSSISIFNWVISSVNFFIWSFCKLITLLLLFVFSKLIFSLSFWYFFSLSEFFFSNSDIFSSLNEISFWRLKLLFFKTDNSCFNCSNSCCIFFCFWFAWFELSSFSLFKFIFWDFNWFISFCNILFESDNSLIFSLCCLIISFFSSFNFFFSWVKSSTILFNSEASFSEYITLFFNSCIILSLSFNCPFIKFELLCDVVLFFNSSFSFFNSEISFNNLFILSSLLSLLLNPLLILLLLLLLLLLLFFWISSFWLFNIVFEIFEFPSVPMLLDTWDGKFKLLFFDSNCFNNDLGNSICTSKFPFPKEHLISIILTSLFLISLKFIFPIPAVLYPVFVFICKKKSNSESKLIKEISSIFNSICSFISVQFVSFSNLNPSCVSTFSLFKFLIWDKTLNLKFTE